MLNVFNHPSEVNNIALQAGTNCDLFATACGGVVRLFDTRQQDKTGEIDAPKSYYNKK